MREEGRGKRLAWLFRQECETCVSTLFVMRYDGRRSVSSSLRVELAAEVNRIRAENEQIKAQMAEILRKLSLSDNVNKSAVR